MSKDIRGRVAIVQMDCVLGETRPNLEKIRHFTEAAGRLGVDLVVFPECATTGYFIADRLSELAEPPDGPSLRALAGIAGANRLSPRGRAWSSRKAGGTSIPRCCSGRTARVSRSTTRSICSRPSATPMPPGTGLWWRRRRLARLASRSAMI